MNRRVVPKTCLRLCSVLSGLLLLTHVFFAQAAGRPVAPNAQAGVVRGRVTLDDGRPAAGFRVVARTFPARPRNDAEAVTDSDGRYVLPLAFPLSLIGPFSGPPGLRVGQFGILVDTGDGPYLETPPQIVTLPASTATPAKPAAFTADFVLHPGPPVTVRVRDAETGRPIAGVPVEMAANLFSSGWRPVGRTDGRGELRLRISRLDADLRVDFRGRTPTVGPAPGYHAEDQIRLTTTQAVVWDVRTYDDPDQPKGATFRGVVTGADGRPVADALVRFGGAQSVTDAQGRFSFQGHRMTEYEREARRVFLTAEKDGERALAYPTPEQTWTTLPLRLAPTPTTTLTGIAVDAQGHPLAGVPLHCDGWLRDFPVPAPAGPSVTDADGRFEVLGLYPDAAYRVTLGGRLPDGADSVYGATFLPALPHPEWNLLGGEGQALTFAPGDHKNLGRIVVLRADRTITGRIVDRQGRPVTSEVEISLTGLHTNSACHTDAEGRFRAEHLAREPLILSAYAPEIGPGTSRSWSSGPDSHDLIGRTPVSAGAHTVRLTVDRPPVPPPSPPAVQPPAVQPSAVSIVRPAATPLREALPPGPAHGPTRDEAQALRVARRFLDGIGWTGNLAVRSLQTGPNPGPPAGPLWLMQILADATGEGDQPGSVTIAADTGAITEAGLPLSARLATGSVTGGATDGGPRLTQAQALDHVQAIFRTTGMQAGYEITGIYAAPGQWQVSLQPVFHGIPYRLVGFARMALDIRTGALQSLELDRPWTADPPSALPAVDRAHALRAADAAWGASPPRPSEIYAALWVVPEAPFLAGGLHRHGGPRPARLAWVLDRMTPAPPTGIKEIWVDAQSGAVLPWPPLGPTAHSGQGRVRAGARAAYHGTTPSSSK